MIPPTTCTPDEACCVDLYDIANHLLAETYDAVSSCYPTSCCDALAAYVTLGTGDDGAVDALTVAVASVAGSANTAAGGLGLWKATYTVMLRESGWPIGRVEGGQIVMPPPSEQAAAARHVFAMGEAIHRRLSTLQRLRMLTPRTVRCSNASVGTMTPLNPRGGVVGWSTPITVDLPWN